MNQTKVTIGIIFALGFMLSMLYSADFSFKGLQEEPPRIKPTTECEAPLPKQCYVSFVYDGDTIACQFSKTNKHSERVRLLGIDAPETEHSAKNKTGKPEPYATEAQQRLRELVDHQTVLLEYDMKPYDRYGRKLAYVSLAASPEKMINSQLLEEGYVKLLIIKPNTHHSEELSQKEALAKRRRTGLWGR